MNLERRNAKLQKRMNKLRFKIAHLEDLSYEIYREMHKNDPPNRETAINKITKEIYSSILVEQLRNETRLTTKILPGGCDE